MQKTNIDSSPDIPGKLQDLGGKKYLTVYGVDGQVYEGNSPSLDWRSNHMTGSFVLTINLLSGGVKVFNDAVAEVQAITRHT
ncbi:MULTISPECIES: hypothetical protein [Pseudomonas]|uniref:hypothetical protein n=1 Tax=Pseudomonas TaxID=286 RepID=UPI00111C6F45|nr:MULTISPECIES: hypothetical protein [Pseudomonas]UIN53471.1 hypothetical protein LXN51_21235 [Pseudomonas kribbensis]